MKKSQELEKYLSYLKFHSNLFKIIKWTVILIPPFLAVLNLLYYSGQYNLIIYFILILGLIVLYFLYKKERLVYDKISREIYKELYTKEDLLTDDEVLFFFNPINKKKLQFYIYKNELQEKLNLEISQSTNKSETIKNFQNTHEVLIFNKKIIGIKAANINLKL